MTPISPNEFAKIAERMRQNEEALERCRQHDFEMRYLYGDAVPPRYVCRACSGIIDQTTYEWYARGARDARMGKPAAQPEQPPQHL